MVTNCRINAYDESSVVAKQSIRDSKLISCPHQEGTIEIILPARSLQQIFHLSSREILRMMTVWVGVILNLR